jgi:hypothetical protein
MKQGIGYVLCSMCIEINSLRELIGNFSKEEHLRVIWYCLISRSHCIGKSDVEFQTNIDNTKVQ